MDFFKNEQVPFCRHLEVLSFRRAMGLVRTGEGEDEQRGSVLADRQVLRTAGLELHDVLDLGAVFRLRRVLVWIQGQAQVPLF